MKGIFQYKLRNYNEDYYLIYDRLNKVNFDKIPSFRWMKQQINAQKNDYILDAGCGVGHHLNYVCAGTAEGVGVDSSEVALRIASSKFPRYRFEEQDLQNLYFEDERFDKIICFNVIEHIRNQDLVMKELKRVLKKNGTIVIGTNIRNSLCWKLYQMFITERTHEHEFTVREFVKFVSLYFRVEKTAVLSGVFRFKPPLVWLFHYWLKGDILIKGRKC